MSTWLQRIGQTIDALKASNTEAFLSGEGFLLRAVSTQPPAAQAALFTAWRNTNPEAFFTWFQATQATTQHWLREIYGPNSCDLMTTLEDTDCVPFGHLALSAFNPEERSCELGRVLRGSPGGPRGGIGRSISALARWAGEQLDVARVDLEVFADNGVAIACYERCGFRASGSWPLTRVDTEARTSWLRADGLERPERFALKMSLEL